MNPTVRESGSGAVIEFGDLRAFAHTRQVTVRVDTMTHPQHHRGHVGTVQIKGDRTQHTCGHRLHQKRGAARRCAIAEAKRMLRALAKEGTP